MATFSLHLQRRVESGLVVSGKFDGTHACLVAATSAGNILLHSPHRQPTTKLNDSDSVQPDEKLAWSGELAELQISKQVTALCTGRFGDDERDVLLIGTLTHVLAYHVEENADVFYKEMPDSVHCLTMGKLGWLADQVVIIGGNCSVTFLDSHGTEVFWIITTGIVMSLAILDFDGDDANELLIGTEDFDVRVQKDELVLWETKETAPVTVLTSLPGRQFAYAVENGTVGVYEAGQRLWRVKSKHKVVSMRSFDMNGDGIAELITSWSSGKVDARSCITGEVTFRVQLSAGVAGLVEADYRRTGRADLIMVSVIGEVRGYGHGSSTKIREPGETVRELLVRKQVLQLELRRRTASISNTYDSTRLAVGLSSGKGAVRFAMASGPGLLVHCAIVFAEGVFEGETLVTHPNRPKGELEIELRPSRNEPVDIHVKTCVGPAGADLFQVFELTRQLPRFCMYEVISRPEVIPENLKECHVVVEIAERPQRIALWLNQSLIIAEELEVAEQGSGAGSIELWLRGLRDDSIHYFSANTSGRVNIETEDPMFAGDIVQSLASYLGLRKLSSEAKFPSEESKMADALQHVKGLKMVETTLQAEAAGKSTLLKNLIIRLENAWILRDVDDMKRKLSQLKIVSGDLIREHEIRMNSQRDLVATLKKLNVGIQRASRLRVGKAAANAVTRCRTAIRDENPKALILALRHG